MGSHSFLRSEHAGRAAILASKAGAIMEKNSTPIWETVVMCGSFVLLWGWFLAQKAAEHAHKPLPMLWNAALLLALATLIVITVRRVKRVQRALRGEDDDNSK